jgi:hypothetical protein
MSVPGATHSTALNVDQRPARSLLDETGAPTGVQQKLIRHSNVAATMNVYGSATIRAKQHPNSKVAQMVTTQERPGEVERLAAV